MPLIRAAEPAERGPRLEPMLHGFGAIVRGDLALAKRGLDRAMERLSGAKLLQYEELFAIETHLLNFHPLELTPQTEVEICFLERMRDEIKFPSVEALREQIARDVKKARRYFRLLGRGKLGS